MIGALLALSLAATPLRPFTIASPEYHVVKVPSGVALFAAEYVAQRFSESDLKVVTPRQLSVILGMERQKQLLGCGEDEASCTMELGNALGADAVLLGDLVKLGKRLVVNFRVLRTRDGSPIASASGNADGEGELPAALDKAVESLRDQIQAHREKEAQLEREAAQKEAREKAEKEQAEREKIARANGRPALTPSAGGLRRRAWIPAVGAGVAAGLGAVFSGLAWSTHRQLLETSPGPAIDATSFQHAGETQQTLSFVAYSVAGAALLCAGAFYFFGAPPPVQPSVTIGPGGASLGLSWLLP